MTVNEKLMDEFGCAISAIFGDLEDEEYEEGKVSFDDLLAIARKVAFYMDLR